MSERLRFLSFVERFVAVIAGRAEDLAVSSHHTTPFNPGASWVYFGRHAEPTVAIAWGEPRSAAAQGAVEAATAHRIGRTSVLPGWGVAPSFSAIFPRCQTRIELLSAHGQTREAWFASIGAPWEDLPATPAPIETLILNRARVVVPVVLRGVTTVLQRGALLFCDVCGVVLAAETRWSRRWERRGDGFNVTLEEPMEEQAHAERTQLLEMGVMVDVVVDGFELTLGEVMALRPGSEVTFPCGPEIRGTARVAGGAVATVTLAFEPTGLVARVVDLAPLTEDAQKSVNTHAVCPIQTAEYPRGTRPHGDVAPGKEQKLIMVEES